MTIGIVSSVFETNMTEVVGVGTPLLLIGLPIMALLFVLLLFSVKELRKVKINLKKISLYTLLGILLFVIVCGMFVFFFFDQRRIDKMKALTKDQPILYVDMLMSEHLPLIVAPCMTTICYFSEKYRFQKELLKERTLPEGVSLKDSVSNLPETIYVIIGESSARDHYSLYGYDKKTTPFLDSISRVDSAFHYYEGVSSASITRDGVRLSLSFATAQNKKPYFDNKNNIQLAKDAGYETYWISNQNSVGLHESYIGLIASYADSSMFFNYSKDDLFLVSKIKELYNPQKKQIFYIQLIGSHIPYQERFDEIDAKALNEKSETLDYDRTIHHTDRFLEKLYNQVHSFKDNNSIIYYYSDHGEVVNVGHGMFLREGGKTQFKIPFIVMPVNCDFDARRVINRYIVNGYFNSVNMNYVLAESMGYNVDESIIDQAKIDARYIFFVNDQPYLYEKLKD